MTVVDNTLFELIDILTTLPQMVLTAWILSLYLNTKRRWLYIVVFTVASVIEIIISASLGAGSELQTSAILGVAFIVLPTFAFNRKQPVSVTVACLVSMLCLFIAEAIVCPIVMALTGTVTIEQVFERTTRGVQLLIYFRVAYIAILSLIYYIIYGFVRRSKSARIDRRAISPFLPFVSTQALVYIILVICFYYYMPGYMGFYVILGILAAFIVSDFFMIKAMKHLNEGILDREKAALFEKQLKVQLEYYEKLHDSIQQTRKLRHDYSNHLRTLRELMQSDQPQAAKQLLDSLSNGIGNMEREQYCRQPIINAVIAAPARQCAERGIAFRHELRVPISLPLDDIDLCCLFSNLLDNAVDAASGSGAEAPFVELKAALRGEALAVTIRNSKDPRQNPQREKWRSHKDELDHGWGIRLIRDVVERYKGDLLAEDSGTEMSITAVLNFPAGE